MTAVTPSTNRDSPWIAWAGVETGAKMFVGLSGADVDCADVVATRKHTPARTRDATRMRETELTRSTDHPGARSAPQTAPVARCGVTFTRRYWSRRTVAGSRR